MDAPAPSTRRGATCSSLAAFDEDFRVLDLDAASVLPPAAAPETAAEIRRALVMGIQDYFQKTGFSRAVIGLSGGVDSGVTACLAAEALGPDAVRCVALPGPYSSAISLAGREGAVGGPGRRLRSVPIQGPYEALRAALEPLFADRPFDVTEENLQARVRGTLLMALSNKFGSLVLATGNKSEMAVGYATLYGDMNGGLAVLSDVWKTQVYELAQHYYAEGKLPLRVIERPPSAELAPDQKDEDSLPPYPVLDRILRQRVEEGRSLHEIVASGEDGAVAERVLRMLERSEYKRRQMAPGLKVTPTAFGVGWRMPIARPVDLSAER